MSNNGSRLSLVFSCLGHFYVHLFTAFYFVIVLSLEDVWALPYHELIELWTLGALMVGLVALPAGWLSDRVGAPIMMIAFFLGLGASSLFAGFADGPRMLMLSLGGIGVFAAIYHPVGIPWLVRVAREGRQGQLLAFNGIFGSLGVAGAAMVAGTLIDLSGWRAAFIIPGLVSLTTGIVMLVCLWAGRLQHDGVAAVEKPKHSRRDQLRVFVILLFSMFAAGLIYQSIQGALPKVLEIRHEGIAGEGVSGIGALVATIYALAGFAQLIGGYLADRFPLKWVYVGTYLAQVPLLWLAAGLAGLPFMLVAAMMVMVGAGALPVENMLLARYAPSHRQGLAFGMKFVLTFGAGPVAVQFLALVVAHTGNFYWVFSSLAALALAATLLALWLPRNAGGLSARLAIAK